MVVERGALAAQHGRRFAGGVRGPRPADQRGLGRGGAQRGRRDPAETDHGALDRAGGAIGGDLEGEGHRDAGDVVEPPFGDLVEGDGRGERQRDPDGPDELAGLHERLPVAGEVLSQRYLAVATGAGQHQRGLQRQQRGRGVADGGCRADVATDGGAVADQPGGELRPHLVQQRDAPCQQPLGLGQRQRRADLDAVGPDGERAQLRQPVDGHRQRGSRAPDVDLDPPVGAAGHHDSVRPLGQQGQRLGQVCRSDELGLADPHPGVGGPWRRRCAAARERVVRGRGVEGVGGVPDRAVTRAAAEVPAQRVQVEPVRAVLMILSVVRGRRGPVARGGGLGGGPLGPVVLGRHAADEAGRAVAALGAATAGHLVLHRVQCARLAEALRGDQFLPVEGQDRHQAGVERGPAGAVVPVRPGDQHRARAAFALGAALLGAGETLVRNQSSAVT